MKWIPTFFMFSILLFLPTRAISQQGKDFVSGILKEKYSQKPIPFATLHLKEKSFGVISNQDGGFRIPKYFFEEGRTLQISCLGYKTIEIYLSNLKFNDQNVIYIENEPISLKESIVVGKRKNPPNARKIVKRAFERIPQNYPNSPFSYVGYYRDYQLKNDKYINLNEALLNVIDKGFTTVDFDSTKIQIYDYKPNMDFERDTLSIKPYDYISKQKVIKNAYLFNFGGNEVSILRIHDAVRNFNVNTYSFIDIPKKGVIKNHSLTRLRDKTIDGEPMYVISLEKSNAELDTSEFQNEPKISKFIAKGKIYISKFTYAIKRLEYQVFDNKRSKNKKLSPSLIFEVEMEYKELNDKMYVNYISFHNSFTVQKSLFKIEEIIIDEEKKCFDLRFNKTPIRFIDWTQENFHVRFKNKKVKIKKIKPTQNGYLLYPDLEIFNEITEELKSQYGDSQYFSPEILEFQFVNLLDTSGNEINSFYSEEYNQYREFFTQEVKEHNEFAVPSYTLMNKVIPLFYNQPIFKPTNFDEFWMNTPLISK